MRSMALLISLLLVSSPGYSRLASIPATPSGQAPPGDSVAPPADTGEGSRRAERRPACPMPVLRPHTAGTRPAGLPAPRVRDPDQVVHSGMPIVRSGCWNPLDFGPGSAPPSDSVAPEGQRRPQ